jgi:hypothetical protein
LNEGSIAPVVASNAKIRLRTTSSPVLPKVPDGLTEVNVPAAMILLPIWVIALTDPFITCGVELAGFAETTWLPWSALTAPAGGAESPTAVSDAMSRAAPLRRRCVSMVFSRPKIRDRPRAALHLRLAANPPERTKVTSPGRRTALTYPNAGTR